MTRNIRLASFIAVPIAVLFLPVAAFLIDRAANDGEVPRNVSVRGVALGGLGEEDAMKTLGEIEADLRSKSAVFVVNGHEFDLNASMVDLAVAKDKVITEAMAQRRDGGFFTQLQAWLASFGDQRELELPVSIDENRLESFLVSWENQAVANPAFDGDIDVVDGEAVPLYPRSGQRVAREAAHQIVFLQVANGEVSPRELPLESVEPQLTEADIDLVVAEANRVLSDPVVLSVPDKELEIVFTTEFLAEALRTELVESPSTELRLELSEEAVEAFLTPYMDDIEDPPVDARFIINDDDTVTISPSKPGTVVDITQVTDTLYSTALGRDEATFPLAEGALPDFSTDDALAMGTIRLESEYTTKHPSGQPRVVNIHTMADTVNGTVVWPGEKFSLNDHVGRRTSAKGYVPAPMILHGEIVDDVGGGVSQFATTFYNAVFFGCYEDVTHQPHSFYFDRYPEGREATISWPVPDLVFRNDSDAVVIIQTRYTSSSITVRFFGNNGGKECDARKSDRYAITDPPIEYIEDASLAPTSEIVEANGTQGWSVTITRIITMPDGSVVEEKDSHTYQPRPRKIRVHPCNVPGSTTVCPTQIPSVIGLGLADAEASLAAAGFVLVQGSTVEVENEASDGLIVTQSPDSGDYADAGATVTVSVGVYVPPPPPEEPPPDDGEEPPPDDGEDPPPDEGG